MGKLEHKWDVTLEEAVNIQNKLARRIKLAPLKQMPRRIAGLAYKSLDEKNIAIAIIVMSYPTMEFLEKQKGVYPVYFPYQPGFAAFYAAPGILKAFSFLKKKPDLMMCNGHGIAHPRGFGLASHIGLLLSSPSIGCATSLLYGAPMGGIEKERGAIVPILSSVGNTIGMMVRTKMGVHPVVVSCGHLITLEDAVDITLKSVQRFRLPEPLRMAQIAVRNLTGAS